MKLKKVAALVAADAVATNLVACSSFSGGSATTAAAETTAAVAETKAEETTAAAAEKQKESRLDLQTDTTETVTVRQKKICRHLKNCWI